MTGTRLSPELLSRLREEAGAELLREAELLRADPFAAQRLRSRVPAGCGDPEALAAAAVEQVHLRERARVKFARAAEMWFTGPLLEQSSGEVVAAHRLERFRQAGLGEAEVGDLCCGLGGDSLMLAREFSVRAVDRDPLALALTAANAAVLGLGERVVTGAAELPEGAPDVPAAWVDPGRREGGKRTRRVDAMSPTLEEVLALRTRIPRLGVKLSPATPDAELDAALEGIPHEREYLSTFGECRELALWLGDWAGAADAAAHGRTVRATVLPAGLSLTGTPAPFEPVRELDAYLYEPDPAVIRAGLVPLLARQMGAGFIDPRLAYLTSAGVHATPLAQGYRILGKDSFSGKALAEWLRREEAGDVVLKTRGAAIEPETLHRQLRRVLKHGRPDRRPVVFLTRLAGRAIMILGERLGAGTR